jgi:hypothetical protein
VLPVSNRRTTISLVRNRWDRLNEDQRREQTARMREARAAKRKADYDAAVQHAADAIGALSPEQRDKLALILGGAK